MNLLDFAAAAPPLSPDGLTAELLDVACRTRARDHQSPGWPSEMDALVGISFDLDQQFCRELADRFDRAPLRSNDAELMQRYACAIAETRTQYEGILATGVRVTPWRGKGPPYQTGQAIGDHVRRTRRIRLQLTASAHGPDRPRGHHPLRAPSGTTADGAPLCHNDHLRVAHDLFGHVLGSTGFGPAGELVAAYRHMLMYSNAARPVLLTEHVAQVCWFYFGRHLRDANGEIPGPGADGYIRPSDRPYPPQKVFSIESEYLDRFAAMFGACSRRH